MKKEFFDLCKKNDRRLRIAMGETRRITMFGQIEREEQDFYVLALDRSFFASPDCNRGFILTVNKDEKNVIFNAYLDFVDDMYSIGHVEIGQNGMDLETNQTILNDIESKINQLNIANDSSLTESQLLELLSTNETWFVDYLTSNRWTFEPEKSFKKRELSEAVKMYKVISSLAQEHNLTNASTFGE